MNIELNIISLSNGFKNSAITDLDIVQSKSRKIVQSVVNRAGITDILISVEFVKVSKDLDKALELATINTILNTNGTVQIN